MSVITDEKSAIRVEPANYEQTVKDLAEAAGKLIEDEILREQMGQAGRKRIAEVYNWETKGEFMEELLY
jgi:glycosyltransferase involved in cell wall biosynthesis